MTALARLLEDLSKSIRSQPKIQEARASDFDLVAPGGNIEPGEDVRCQLPRVQLALFGQCHQGGRLIVSELRIGAGPHHDAVA